MCGHPTGRQTECRPSAALQGVQSSRYEHVDGILEVGKLHHLVDHWTVSASPLSVPDAPHGPATFQPSHSKVMTPFASVYPPRYPPSPRLGNCSTDAPLSYEDEARHLRVVADAIRQFTIEGEGARWPRQRRKFCCCPRSRQGTSWSLTCSRWRSRPRTSACCAKHEEHDDCATAKSGVHLADPTLSGSASLRSRRPNSVRPKEREARAARCNAWLGSGHCGVSTPGTLAEWACHDLRARLPLPKGCHHFARRGSCPLTAALIGIHCDAGIRSKTPASRIREAQG